MQLNDYIKQYNNNEISLRQLIYIVRNHEDINKEVYEFTDFLKNDEDILERLYYVIHDLHEIVTCKYCSKKAEWSGRIGNGYKTTCGSYICKAMHASMTREKYKDSFEIAKHRDSKFVDWQNSITELDEMNDYIIKNHIIYDKYVPLITNKYILDYLNNRYKDSASILETVQRIRKGVEEKPTCPVCGKPVIWVGKNTKLYTKYCSTSCSSKAPRFKYIPTLLIKYTVDDNINEIIEKQDKIDIEKEKQEKLKKSIHNKDKETKKTSSINDVFPIKTETNSLDIKSEKKKEKIVDKNTPISDLLSKPKYKPVLINGEEETEENMCKSANATSAHVNEIVDKYLDREFEKIQNIYFPPSTVHPVTELDCIKEFEYIKSKDRNLKTPSKIIKMFHKSIIYAHIENSVSPFDGWNMIKNDKELFRKLLCNRLKFADWYKSEEHRKYIDLCYVPDFIYGIGLNASRMFQTVTYFKPDLAKYLIKKYLNEFDTIFDPFSGYSGRMIGTLACNKSYIGRDLCESSVKESKEIYKFLKPIIDSDLLVNVTCDLGIADCCKNTGKYQCLLTCSPYGNIENWPGVESVNRGCDRWIDICLKNYDCQKYLFVTDDLITKYVPYIKETLTNRSHFGSNKEYVVIITKEERDKIIQNIKG